MITRRVGHLVWLSCALVFLSSYTGVAAADPPVVALSFDGATEFGSAQQLSVTPVVHNGTGQACVVAADSQTSVVVTAVERDGQPEYPEVHRTTVYAEAPDATVTVEAGAAANLAALKAPRGRVDIWSDSGNGTSVIAGWDVSRPGRYTVTAVLQNTAAERRDCAVSAPASFSFTIGGAARGFPWMSAIAAALAVVVAAALVVFVRRRRRATGAAVVALGLIAAGLPLYSAPQARAEIVLPDDPDYVSAFNACMGTYRSPGGDPAGLLPRLQGSKKRIFFLPIDGDRPHTTIEMNGDEEVVVVYWDPRKPVQVDGSDWGPSAPFPVEPCAAGYHEGSHAASLGNEGADTRPCGNTGLDYEEVQAVLAERAFEKAFGLPVRGNYRGKNVPANLDDCRENLPPAGPPSPPPVQTQGGSSGDPHLRQYDGGLVHMQGAGEYVLTRSTAGGCTPFEVQVRQQPYPGSKSVAINTGEAIRLGDNRISVVRRGVGAQVTVNGHALGATENWSSGPVRLEHGPSADPSGLDRITISGPGDALVVLDVPKFWGIDAGVTPPACAGTARVGLLGGRNGNRDDDIAARDGQVVSSPLGLDAARSDWAESWRVRPEESLFDYGPGESTDAFTDRTFPAKPVEIPDRSKAAAGRVCRALGVVDDAYLTACVIDTAVTGLAAFAASARLAQQAAETGTSRPNETRGTIAVTAGVGQADFPAAAGEVLYASAELPRSECINVIWSIVGPNGDRIGGPAGGCSDMGRVVTTGAGVHRIVVESSDGRPHEFRYTIVHNPPDVVLPLPLDVPVRGRVDAPGRRVQYRFEAIAGQTLTVTSPRSCGLLVMKIADGPVTGFCGGQVSGHIETSGEFVVSVFAFDRTTDDFEFTATLR